MMEIKVVLAIILSVTCFASVYAVPVSALIKVAETTFNVLELGVSVLENVNKFKSGDETTVDLTDIVNQVNARIDASTTKIIKASLLQSKLGRVDDAFINIHSSLIDLNDFLQARTMAEKHERMDLYLSRFEEHDLIKHIRFLPELLEHTIPGTAGKLLDLFVDNTRCNMTALYEFKQFYSELISDGIALQLIHLRMSTDLPLQSTLEYWRSRVNEITVTFDNKENSCMQKFSRYAKEDLEAADNAMKLWTDNKDRYPWKTCDVMFLRKYGTYQFLYHKHTSDYLFLQKSDKNNKIAIFADKQDIGLNSNTLRDAKDVFRSAIQGETDTSAAKNVGEAVENNINRLGYDIKALLVFFDGDDFSSEKVIIDDDSNVLLLTIEDVKLQFCYESGFECKLDVLNWFGGQKSVVGEMKVFAYVENSKLGGQNYQTGSGYKNDSFTTSFYLLMSLGITFFIKTMP